VLPGPNALDTKPTCWIRDMRKKKKGSSKGMAGKFKGYRDAQKSGDPGFGPALWSAKDWFSAIDEGSLPSICFVNPRNGHGRKGNIQEKAMARNVRGARPAGTTNIGRRWVFQGVYPDRLLKL